MTQEGLVDQMIRKALVQSADGGWDSHRRGWVMVGVTKEDAIAGMTRLRERGEVTRDAGYIYRLTRLGLTRDTDVAVEQLSARVSGLEHA